MIDINNVHSFSELVNAETYLEARRPKSNTVTATDYWIILCGKQILLVYNKRTASFVLPQGEKSPIEFDPAKVVHQIALPGSTQSIAKAIGIDKIIDPEKISKLSPLKEDALTYKWVGIRECYEMIALPLHIVASKAKQMIHWENTHKYCGHCGTKLIQELPNMVKCPNCGLEVFPRISPAMIVLIYQKRPKNDPNYLHDKILLVQAKTFRKDFKGLVAGYVEVGETIEETVHREIKEETNLSIKNLKYYASQPWPYPSELMIGFTAEYDSGDIQLQEEELLNGKFYRLDELPVVPKKISLARKLIDYYIDCKGKV